MLKLKLFHYVLAKKYYRQKYQVLIGWILVGAVHEHGHQRKRINNVWSAIEISELDCSHSAEYWCCVDHA
jgi:hypothetical protein